MRKNIAPQYFINHIDGHIDALGSQRRGGVRGAGGREQVGEQPARGGAEEGRSARNSSRASSTCEKEFERNRVQTTARGSQLATGAPPRYCCMSSEWKSFRRGREWGAMAERVEDTACMCRGITARESRALAWQRARQSVASREGGEECVAAAPAGVYPASSSAGEACTVAGRSRLSSRGTALHVSVASSSPSQSFTLAQPAEWYSPSSNTKLNPPLWSNSFEQ